MSIAGVEPVMDELRAQFQTYLPAKITALQPTFTPVLPMPAPKAYVFGEREVFFEGLPVLQLLARPSTVRNEDLRWQDHMHVIDVAVFIGDVDQENVQRLLFRYARCVLETFAERRKAGAFTLDLTLRSREIDYSPLAQLREAQFVRAVFIPVAASRRGSGGLELH